MKFNRAVTLLELSIVLVVIGLLAGSINLARELMTNATATKDINNIRLHADAVSAFRDNFNALPGDYKDAVQTLGTLEAGDGNGLITETAGGTGSLPITIENTFGINEIPLVFEQLSKARLLPVLYDGTKVVATPGVNFPLLSADQNAKNGMLIYSNNTGTLNMYLGFSDISSSNIPNITYGSTAYTPIKAYYIDKKIDDGLPLTGNLTATHYYIFNVDGSFSPGPPKVGSFATFSGVTYYNGCASGNEYYLYTPAADCALNLKL